MQTPAPPGAGLECEKLSLDQSNVSRAGSLRRFLGCELHSLSLSKQLEDRPSHSAAMEEVFDAALIAYESKTFIDEETCNSPGRHSRVLRCAKT